MVAHEFGHFLGLSHSIVYGVLMFPSFSFTDPDRFSVSNDDITAIQSLYGWYDLQDYIYSLRVKCIELFVY